MLGRIALLFTLLLIGTAVLSGAWFGSPAQSMPMPETDFVAQEAPLDPELIGAGIDAANLLGKAIQRLEADQTGWLRMKIRQTMNGPDARFVAEGFLQRGPNHCVRLEMDVIRNKTRGRLTMVSDGTVLAKVQALPGSPDAIAIEHLPPSTLPKEREAFLSRHGCGGPITLLRQLRNHVQNATLQTGMLANHAVIRIDGIAAPDSLPTRIYLDAKTLWLLRIDWPERGSRIEYADIEIGHELSEDECARVFSYQPADKERVAQK